MDDPQSQRIADRAPNAKVFQPHEAVFLADDPHLRSYLDITTEQVAGLLAALGEYAARAGKTVPPKVWLRAARDYAVATKSHNTLLEFWLSRNSPVYESVQPNRANHATAARTAFQFGRHVFDESRRRELANHKYIGGLEDVSVGELCVLIENLDRYAQNAWHLPELAGVTREGTLPRMIHAHNKLIAFGNAPFTLDQFRSSAVAALRRVRGTAVARPRIGYQARVRPESASLPSRPTAITKHETPDYAHAILAWRMWLVTPNDYGARRTEPLEPRLASITHAARWEPYRALQARHGPPCDPNKGCGCGIYALKDPEQLRREAWFIQRNAGVRVHWIAGQVWLWGRFAEHEHGWRAEFAYPAKFVFALGCNGRALAATYGIQYEEDESWTSAKRFEGESRSHFAYRSLNTPNTASRLTPTSLPPVQNPSCLMKFPRNGYWFDKPRWKRPVQLLCRIGRPIGRAWRVGWRHWSATRRTLANVHDNFANQRWSCSTGLNIWR